MPKAHWIVLPALSFCDAVVMMADLIAAGDQLGCFALMSVAIPAMCGEDIEVPE